MRDVVFILLYGLPIIVITMWYLRRTKFQEARAAAALEKSLQSGLTEPPSLHPSFDPNVCMGGGACALACPEHAIGIIDGKGQLVNPTVCIGHGACAASCPVDAITLVFGTERRGVDIPYVKPTFETNVSGIFIAGELGGMGLVRKAAEQGKQAIASIRKLPPAGDQLDVVIVGAGPAGLAATLGAMEQKLKFVTIEQEDSLGGTVYHYPRNKIVMTQPVRLPLVGLAKLGEISKESLLAFWQGIVDRVQMPIQFSERMEKIEAVENGYIVRTSTKTYRAGSVLLAIGRRGTPRKLSVPGEEQSKVVYRLVDPEQYRGQKVIVVGGGDSAIEAALALAAEPDTNVTLSYRGDAFGRIKAKNRERLADAQEAGRLTVALGSNVVSIAHDHVLLNDGAQQLTLENDVVIVCAGGILPTPMLKEIGIQVETKYGMA